MEGRSFETVLCLIAERFQEQKIEWALGASGMLKLRGFDVVPEDVDLMISEASLERGLSLLRTLGEERVAAPKPPYRTEHFHSFLIGDAELDLLCNFAIEHERGITRHRFDAAYLSRGHIGNTAIPLSALEEWLVFYLLMPKREAKAALIEAYLVKHGLEQPQALQRALQETLPPSARHRIERLLNDVCS